MERTKIIKLIDLCKGHFLQQLYKYFSFKDKGYYYENILISKCSNYNNLNLNYQFISIERKSHEGFKKNLENISSEENFQSENEENEDN